MTRLPYRRVLLVGLMGSGKTTVGRILADRLGWRFVDFDDVVEAREGAPVSEIFRTAGEDHFRRVEASVADDLLARDHVVLGSGGGWAAAEGRLDRTPEGTASVWLQVGPEEAARRAGAQGHTRPLLSGGDPVAAAERLLHTRSRLYARARICVDTEGRSPDEVADLIIENLSTDAP